MRFVHTADWQLGMTRHYLNGEAQPRYSAARRDVVAGLGPLAADAGAEFVVVAGDVFEHNQLAPRDVSQSLEAMRAIGIPVYLLPGNHDPLDASSVYTSALFTAECPDNVTVLDRAGVHEVRPGLQIVAAPWRSKAPTSDLVGDVLGDLPADGVTRIVVGHGGVDVLDPDPDKPSLIRLAALEAAIARGAVHYVALGDKHSRTAGGFHRPGVVLGLAGGHQLRRHRGRPRSRAARRHRRGRRAAPGAGRRATRSAGGGS